jgi:anti-sigma factor RsiW
MSAADSPLEIHCTQELLLQADFDGELNPSESAALENHRASCAICQEALGRLQRARSLLQNASRARAPDSLRDKLQKQLRAQDQGIAAVPPNLRVTKFRYLISGGSVGAIAAGLLVFVFLGMPVERTPESLVDNHVRAMQTQSHLLDVVSSEHHTVKPWFAGQIAFAPPVKDLEAYGYPLRGGRIDVFKQRNVAVLVYQAGKHSIDVSILPKNEVTVSTPQDLHGFNIRQWHDGDFTLWAVSDLNPRELDAFVQHWKSAP